MEVLDRTVLDEAVGNADSFHLGGIAVVGHELQDGTAHTSFQYSVFYCNNPAEIFPDFMQHFFIKGFQEAEVVVGNTATGFFFYP